VVVALDALVKRVARFYLVALELSFFFYDFSRSFSAMSKNHYILRKFVTLFEPILHEFCFVLHFQALTLLLLEFALISDLLSVQLVGQNAGFAIC
jgi:hypothetical protein